MICYKLTDKNMKTRAGMSGETQWVLGEWHEAPGMGALCSAGWLHCYETALLAVLRNPADANYDDHPRLFVCEVAGAEKIEPLKRGYARMRLLREIPIPKLTTEQRVIFAIFCAIESGVENEDWLAWATHYVSGEDGSHTANAAAYAAWSPSANAAAAAAYAANAANAAAANFAALAEEAAAHE